MLGGLRVFKEQHQEREAGLLLVMLRDQERDPPAESLVEPRRLPGCSGRGEKTLPLLSYLC